MLGFGWISKGIEIQSMGYEIQSKEIQPLAVDVSAAHLEVRIIKGLQTRIPTIKLATANNQGSVSRKYKIQKPLAQAYKMKVLS